MIIQSQKHFLGGLNGEAEFIQLRRSVIITLVSQAALFTISSVLVLVICIFV